MYDGLEFRHLASFVAVAEECSFSKAAERLNISQPSLSSQIKQVENGLRANLFIRSQTGASLTRPGAQFLVFARQMLHMRDDAVRATSSDQTGTEWPLRFGYTRCDYRVYLSSGTDTASAADACLSPGKAMRRGTRD